MNEKEEGPYMNLFRRLLQAGRLRFGSGGSEKFLFVSDLVKRHL
jgi:hypothetical protein